MRPAATDHGAPAQWRKSSYSTAGNDCVEVALAGPACAVRDSKNPDGGQLTVRADTWRAFTDRIKHGAYDL